MKILAAALLVPLAACSYSSDDGSPGIGAQGSGSSRTYQAADFSKLALRGSDDVDVRTGTGFSVRAEGPSDELDKLKIVKDGDTLKIGRRNEFGFHWGGGRHHDAVKVYVTMPRLAGAEIAGSGDMTIDRVEGQRFSAESAGSGNLSIATLAVDAADLSIAGSGDMMLTGTAKQLNADIMGSGDVKAEGLKAEGAKVSVAGSGSVTARIAGPASISLMGSGDVDLGPDAHCTTSKMGSGTVNCGH